MHEHYVVARETLTCRRGVQTFSLSFPSFAVGCFVFWRYGAISGANIVSFISFGEFSKTLSCKQSVYLGRKVTRTLSLFRKRVKR